MPSNMLGYYELQIDLSQICGNASINNRFRHQWRLTTTMPRNTFRFGLFRKNSIHFVQFLFLGKNTRFSIVSFYCSASLNENFLLLSILLLCKHPLFLTNRIAFVLESSGPSVSVSSSSCAQFMPTIVQWIWNAMFSWKHRNRFVNKIHVFFSFFFFFSCSNFEFAPNICCCWCCLFLSGFINDFFFQSFSVDNFFE